ncbi:TPA: hypothetical protein HA372_04695 [Candidatus Woesearchaeota archaeon]|nr:hypothetical protein [Candidatus Woesearchaeota archaeon]
MLKGNSVFLGIAAWVMLLLALPLSSAHLGGGIDKEANGYTIDVGYDPDPLLAQHPAYLSIGLFNATTKEAAETDKMWMRLSTDQGVVYAGMYLPENGVAPMSLIFPRGGEYTLAVRFYDGDNPEAVAAADIPLTVNGAAAQGSMLTNAWGVLFMAAGVLVAGVIGYVAGVAASTGKRPGKEKLLNSKSRKSKAKT